jgi:hypothetical protein
VAVGAKVAHSGVAASAFAHSGVASAQIAHSGVAIRQPGFYSERPRLSQSA